MPHRTRNETKRLTVFRLCSTGVSCDMPHADHSPSALWPLSHRRNGSSGERSHGRESRLVRDAVPYTRPGT
jgi:hypothetical protein